jgi:hypothetical protein
LRLRADGVKGVNDLLEFGDGNARGEAVVSAQDWMGELVFRFLGGHVRVALPIRIDLDLAAADLLSCYLIPSVQPLFRAVIPRRRVAP